ncbi:MAG TPA: phosphonate ABC transporter ATP-binding protein [Methylomirabilota bacterium]|jgi:phosphonate transport system ATP-binding protein|nr:phosphonate ABC transporter ATP-binding protein [Methylomirabilota bacterium]
MISIRGLSKTYPGGVTALRDVNIDVKEGEFLVILGPSGAGKSTLMRCINRLVEPDEGRVFHNQEEITGHRRKLKEVRRQFGIVFQQFNLVKRLSVLTNVLTGRLAYRSAWRSLFYNFSQADKLIAIQCLARVNMEHKALQRADTLSGGEQQRVAIARALAQQPIVILADEPVASLDPKIAREVLTYLKQVASELGITVLCNLHQVEYTREFAERVVGMSRGTVVFDGPASELTDDMLHRIYYRDPGSGDEEDESP